MEKVAENTFLPFIGGQIRGMELLEIKGGGQAVVLSDPQAVGGIILDAIDV
ncbi:MAG TPA: hypothetical protein PKB07_18845 [Flavilitoribacter sp.]|nr:hypothetical protein [Flavilitoribacter sp.]